MSPKVSSGTKKILNGGKFDEKKLQKNLAQEQKRICEEPFMN